MQKSGQKQTLPSLQSMRFPITTPPKTVPTTTPQKTVQTTTPTKSVPKQTEAALPKKNQRRHGADDYLNKCNLTKQQRDMIIKRVQKFQLDTKAHLNAGSVLLANRMKNYLIGIINAKIDKYASMKFVDPIEKVTKFYMMEKFTDEKLNGYDEVFVDGVGFEIESLFQKKDKEIADLQKKLASKDEECNKRIDAECNQLRLKISFLEGKISKEEYSMMLALLGNTHKPQPIDVDAE